jgi:hypothetical protein
VPPVVLRTLWHVALYLQVREQSAIFSSFHIITKDCEAIDCPIGTSPTKCVVMNKPFYARCFATSGFFSITNQKHDVSYLTRLSGAGFLIFHSNCDDSFHEDCVGLGTCDNCHLLECGHCLDDGGQLMVCQRCESHYCTGGVDDECNMLRLCSGCEDYVCIFDAACRSTLTQCRHCSDYFCASCKEERLIQCCDDECQAVYCISCIRQVHMLCVMCTSCENFFCGSNIPSCIEVHDERSRKYNIEQSKKGKMKESKAAEGSKKGESAVPNPKVPKDSGVTPAEKGGDVKSPSTEKSAEEVREEVASLGIKSIKQELQARGVDFTHCIEKVDLVEALTKSRVANPTVHPTTPSPAAAPSPSPAAPAAQRTSSNSSSRASLWPEPNDTSADDVSAGHEGASQPRWYFQDLDGSWKRYQLRLEYNLESLLCLGSHHFLYAPGNPDSDGFYAEGYLERGVNYPMQLKFNGQPLASRRVLYGPMIEKELFTGATRKVKREGPAPKMFNFF